MIKTIIGTDAKVFMNQTRNLKQRNILYCVLLILSNDTLYASIGKKKTEKKTRENNKCSCVVGNRC